MLLLWLSACTPDVHPAYDAARTEALTVATERPAAWSPDLVVTVPRDDFEGVIDAALTSALQAQGKGFRIEVLGSSIELHPKLVLDRAKLRPSDDCATCLAFNTRLTGSATFSILGVPGSLPLSVSVGGLFSIEVRDGKYVYAQPRRVNRVGVELNDLGGLRVDPSKAIQDWVTALLGDHLPAIPILTLDTDSIPIRDLRLHTSGDAIAVEALTNVPGARPVGVVPAPTHGMRLALSASALTGLARRAAYQAGTFSYDTAVDPQSIAVSGDTFTMALRIWRLDGRGWWRDYSVTGHLAVDGGKVRLKPDSVAETARSPGAAFADPLAALFEGKILDVVADGIDRTLPGQAAQDLGAVKLGARVTSVSGTADTLVVDADLEVSGAPSSAPASSTQGAGQNR